MAEMAPLDQAGTYRLGFAGDTFNTAWYLARIRPDMAVSFLTGAGTDAISDQLRARIADAGIDGQYVVTVPDRTIGLYLITLDDGERSFSYWRGQSAARCLASDLPAMERALDAHDIIYFSGITLAILDPEARAGFLDALRNARTAGKTIAFDPNLRPALWPDTATMTRSIMDGAATSDIALPSFEDEADFFADANPEATAARYAEAGVWTVAVKNGARPVFYRDPDTAGTIDVAPIASVVDTTAAGDSFNAGILAGLLGGASLKDSVAMACRLSGTVVQARGALVEVDPAVFSI